MIVWCVFVWCGIVECVLVVGAPEALFVVCLRVRSCGYMCVFFFFFFGSVNVVVVVGTRGVRPWVQQCGGMV